MSKELTDILGGFVRTGIATAAGGLIANGYITQSGVDTISGAVVVALIAGWSAWQKKRTAAKLAPK